MPNKLKKKDIYPYVTVLLTVHNEELVIENRIKNLLEIDYPKYLLEILVASDGSTDKSNEIIKSMSKNDPRVKLIITEGGGKSVTQNKAIPRAKGEIIVLTDAGSMFNKKAINRLVKNFNDEKVGCVSGKLILINDKENSISECHDLYWKYEILLRRLESQIGTLHTASGSLMAFRKSLFRFFKCKYGDDCIIPLDIIVQGYKVVHDDNAMVYDVFPSTMEGELRTRIRITLRNITCTLSKLTLLNPFRFPMISISILSHKIFRWMTPYFLIAVFITNFFLLNEGFFYEVAFYCQIMFYFIGFVGFIAEKNNFRLPIASQIFNLILANIGFFLGVLKALFGQKVTSYENKKGHTVS